MVDYSKWNSIIDSDDDDNIYNNCNENMSSMPYVQQLNTNSRVTFGNGKINIENSTCNDSNAMQQHEIQSDHLIHTKNIQNIERNSQSNNQTNLNLETCQDSTIRQPECRNSIIIGGSKESTFLWAQDLQNIRIYIPINNDIRAKNVCITLLDTSQLVVECRMSNSTTVLLDRKLYEDVYGAITHHPVDFRNTKNDDGMMDMDWELIDLPKEFQETDKTRAIKITMYKYIPYNDLLRTIWWKRAFHDGHEMDINTQELSRNPAQQSSLQNAWNMARQKWDNEKTDRLNDSK